MFFSHFAKVHFGLDRTIIATAHGSTAFEAKSKAADRAMIVLSNRTVQTEVNIYMYSKTPITEHPPSEFCWF